MTDARIRDFILSLDDEERRSGETIPEAAVRIFIMNKDGKTCF